MGPCDAVVSSRTVQPGHVHLPNRDGPPKLVIELVWQLIGHTPLDLATV
jgi:hypothetical protein